MYPLGLLVKHFIILLIWALPLAEDVFDVLNLWLISNITDFLYIYKPLCNSVCSLTVVSYKINAIYTFLHICNFME